jgi:hypothetical protein
MFFFCLFAVSHILSQLKSFEIQNLIHVFFQPIVIKDTLALYFSKEVGSKVMFKSLHFDWNTKTSYQALLMLLRNFDILHLSIYLNLVNEVGKCLTLGTNDSPFEAFIFPS